MLMALGQSVYGYSARLQNRKGTGDFTKYGQPVPRPVPTRRVGIAPFLP